MERESTSALYPVFHLATVATMDMASLRYIHVGCTIQYAQCNFRTFNSYPCSLST